jgi:hypothetical protein
MKSSKNPTMPSPVASNSTSRPDAVGSSPAGSDMAFTMCATM